MRTGIVAVAALVGLGILAVVAATWRPPPARGMAAAATGTAAGETAGEHLIRVPPPPFSEGIFPCSDCHEGPGDPERRELGFHEEIQEVFDHDAEHRWCLDCHNNTDRDLLHLSSGELVPFTESYRLCGQCHGDKYRDWRAGVHGRRMGMWNGAKTYYLCVHCHDPHTPGFKPIAPEPPPDRPEEMRR